MTAPIEASSPIIDRPCASPAELIAALTQPAFGSDVTADRWMFRGQHDAAMGLLPSALRPGASLLDPNGRWVVSPFATEREQIAHEVRTLHAFCRTADAAGLELPEDSQALRLRFNKLVRAIDAYLGAPDAYWPPDELLSVCALGQHYGLPTRLLDWSYNPLVSAYFAAEGAARTLGSRVHAENLCVWALSERALDLWQQLHAGATAEGEAALPWIVRVTAPTASNANLRAQKGLFLLVRCPRPISDDEPNLATVSDLVASGRWGNGVIVRFTLGTIHAPALLRTLAQHFITAAAVYPGLGGAVSALKEQSLWDVPAEAPRPGPSY
jgi:hypothetical protein